MTAIDETLLHPSVGTGALVALMGYLVVFIGIVFLLIVVTIMGKVMNVRKAEPAPAASAVPTQATPAPVEKKPEAKGTAGKLKLYNVEPKEAALVMAIVAYKTGKPINELRFRSIKEVKK